jgi:small GTP-binding protein
MVDYDYMFKIILIGDSGTGKSCLLHSYIEGSFKASPTHTLGVEFGSKRVELLGKRLKLQIWDTAGQERFRSVTNSYYRGAAAAVLVYDITCPETFQKLSGWINDVKNYAKKEISLIVVGNKSDLAEERKVTMVEAAGFCQMHSVQMIETSAMTGENVELAFSRVAESVLEKMKEGKMLNFKGIQGGFINRRDRSCNC